MTHTKVRRVYKAHNQNTRAQKQREGFPSNKVALLILSNHLVNLILYHHCIKDFIFLVVVPFFKEGQVPTRLTPRSETKDQPMPLGMSTLDPVQGP
jgi:hypothetical protein